MTFSGEHAPKISNRFLIITILGIIIIIITAVIVAIIVIIIKIRTSGIVQFFIFDLHFHSYLYIIYNDFRSNGGHGQSLLDPIFHSLGASIFGI